ncbi:claudin-4-like [Mugil cephalus]|uniref:claudin-4-like n=1 Tax=Mugil cephalus TaxID=48193 RepID=UPI001FB6C48F|nr:claudin-4-like [Mugil cephalus]
MVSQGIQITGLLMAVLGWLLVVVVCALPTWKVTAFIGANIITAQNIWQGMWMNCVVQSTGQMQCKVYDSVLALPQDLQAARAMIIISIIVGIFGIILAIAGGKCTNCIEDERSKAKASIASGILFIICGLLCLIPVSWSANTIVTNFYNPLLVEAQRYELGGFTMVSMVRQILGFALAVVGFMGTILVCDMPIWKTTLFIGADAVVAQIIWEGLWVVCVVQSTGQLQCKEYASPAALPLDLQAARVLVVIAIIGSAMGILLGIAGGKCTNFVKDPSSKAKVALAAGIVFIVAGVLVLVPACWSAYTIIRDSYPPSTNTQRRELGAALYIGWGSAALQILGGALFCISCPPKESPEHPVKYTGARSTATSTSRTVRRRRRQQQKDSKQS